MMGTWIEWRMERDAANRFGAHPAPRSMRSKRRRARTGRTGTWTNIDNLMKHRVESVRPENYLKTGVMGEETAPPWADRQSDQEQERHLDRRAE
jgi:hypothetical protein